MVDCAFTYIQVILPVKLEWIPFYKTVERGISIGDKVRVEFSHRELIGVVWKIHDSLPEGLPDSKVLPITALENDLASISPAEMKFWKELSEYYMCTIGEVYKTAFPATRLGREQMAAAREARKAIKRQKDIQKLQNDLEKARTRLANAKSDSCKERCSQRLTELGTRLQELENTPVHRESDQKGKGSIEDNIKLSSLQEQCHAGILDSFAQHRTVLLRGVTGSGKTEIYIKLALEAMNKGGSVLYLVPEIALSRQLEDRLRRHFSDSLLVFHSHLSAAQRGRTADMVSSGQYIVLGTRSALFLPHSNLSLVIVDEEHDSSYKQDSPAPRYNGRDSAIMLAKCISPDCNIILGSATPSLESLYNSSAGRYDLVDLDEKYHGGREADIEVIDTIAERKKRGMAGSLSRKLISRIDSVVQSGGQVLLLRSRRSYSPVVQCVECGYIPKCYKCNIALSYHKDTDRLVCHHCGYSTRWDGSCSRCHGDMKGLGTGTQKVEEELSELFPDARIARLDSDTGKNKDNEASTIRDFAEGKIDILVGTQMISKGFDFPGLKLVAVLQADTLLGLQDFRADEKAFQLLQQFRGRCSRRSEQGLFVIQTSQPDHPLYRSLEENDVEIYQNGLLCERQEFRYPPYYKLVQISVNDTLQLRCSSMATALCNELYIKLDRYISGFGMSVTGPYVPAGNFSGSMAIRVCLKRDKSLRECKRDLYHYIIQFERNFKYNGHITIDVDPM